MNYINNNKGINDNEVAVALISGHITRKQYEIIETFISNSLMVTVRAKKVILYFLRLTQFLGKEIMMQIKDVQLANEVGAGIHDLTSTYHKPTSLSDEFELSGSTKRLSCSCGIYDEKLERTSEGEEGYTIWFSEKHGNKRKYQIELVKFDVAKVLEAKLRRSTYESSSFNPKKNICVDEFYADAEIPEEFVNIKADK